MAELQNFHHIANTSISKYILLRLRPRSQIGMAVVRLSYLGYETITLMLSEHNDNISNIGLNAMHWCLILRNGKIGMVL